MIRVRRSEEKSCDLRFGGIRTRFSNEIGTGRAEGVGLSTWRIDHKEEMWLGGEVGWKKGPEAVADGLSCRRIGSEG
ncbi:hypothetical protein KFK09_002419 [Dendrobium nobile]|uniref:Uncharacterized protein n=1 Tax=Dendrobium nobile TaxID=94219 RepID=A0A8T3C197_DENNO|nr:hypothetical protein KFK09_002419 [Dendrobium nobile]